MPTKPFKYRVLQTTFAHDGKLDCSRLYAPGEIIVSATELEIGRCLPVDHIGACADSLLVPNIELLVEA